MDIDSNEYNKLNSIHIWFADTNGYIFGTGARGIAIKNIHLGDLQMFGMDIVFVDRQPSQTTTQLSVRSIIETLQTVLTEIYENSKIDEIIIHLPRMAYSMIDQANIQNQLQKIKFGTCARTTQQSSENAYANLNINLLHV